MSSGVASHYMAAASSSGGPSGPGSGITKLTNCRLVRGSAVVPDDLWMSSATGRIVAAQSAFYSHQLRADAVLDLGGRLVSAGLIDCQLNGAFGFNFSTLESAAAETASSPRATLPTSTSTASNDITASSSSSPSFASSTSSMFPLDTYAKGVRNLNRQLVCTGVTSYLPTLTSQTPDLYRRVLPHLGSSGARCASDGAESLGAHVEGPFLNPRKNGIHNRAVLRVAECIRDVEECYGAANVGADAENVREHGDDDDDEEEELKMPIKLITVAPELGAMTTNVIPELRSRGVLVSIGHTEATYEQARAAVDAGATMVTHLFNAMTPLHHRNPGVLGVLGRPAPPSCASTAFGRRRQPRTRVAEAGQPCAKSNQAMPVSRAPSPSSGRPTETVVVSRRPFFGIIADGIHVHPAAVNMAFHSHPAGCILVTDAMHVAGLPDGTYEWINGGVINRVIKCGKRVVLADRDDGHENKDESLSSSGSESSVDAAPRRDATIAGSAVMLVDCLNNLWQWSGVSVERALATVTDTPARMLGVRGFKGGLEEGMDADVVVWDEEDDWDESEGGGDNGEDDDDADGEPPMLPRPRKLVVFQVWKYGVLVYSRAGGASPILQDDNS